MSYGVGLRNGVAFALGTIPSLTSGGGLRPSLLLNFLSGTLDSRITFSRGTQATQYTSNGTLQYAPNNLLTYSNQADNAAWTKSNSFVQTNLLTFSDAAVANYVSITAPVVNTTPIVGFTNSVYFPYTPAGNIVAYKSFTVTVNTTYTISAYVQMDDNSAPVLSSSSSSGDLTLVVDNNPAPLNLTVTSVGSGVYRVSAGYTTAAFSGTNIGVVKYNTQSAKGFKVTGLQLVQGSVPGDYVATTSAALPVLYADYQGKLRARKLCEDATATTQHRAIQTITLPLGAETASVYAKAGERTKLLIDCSDNTTGNATVRFDLVAVTASVVSSTGSWTGVTGAITTIGNGWYRCSLVGVRGAGTQTVLNFNVLDAGGSSVYTGDGSSGVYIADAQLEAGSTVQAYNDTTSAAYYGPRFDYEPVTKVLRGLLIEESRTNLLLQSNDFITSWNPTNITRTLASTTGPDGTLSGVKLEATAAAATALYQQVTSTATSHTFSVYVKQGTGAAVANTVGFRNITTLTNLVFVTLNFSTGAIAYTVGSTGASATSIGNGWWRVVISVTAGITIGDLVAGYVGWSGAVATAGDFLYAYGAQLEAGAFATSYIPTVGSQVTRAADSASITTLTPWFNAAAGTISAKVLIGALSPNSYGIYAFDDGTTNNAFPSFYTGAALINSRVAGANVFTSTSSAIAATPAVLKEAFAYANADYASSFNGAAPTTQLSGAIPSGINRVQIGAYSGFQMNGWFQALAYYPTRLPNATLQGLTV